jgi:hypothetical protein
MAIEGRAMTCEPISSARTLALNPILPPISRHLIPQAPFPASPLTCKTHRIRARQWSRAKIFSGGAGSAFLPICTVICRAFFLIAGENPNLRPWHLYLANRGHGSRRTNRIIFLKNNSLAFRVHFAVNFAIGNVFR